MDDKTKKLLLTLGIIGVCVVAPVFIYFASLLIACTLSTKPIGISIVFGALLFIVIAACLFIFKPQLKYKITLLILSVIVCALPAIIIAGRFHGSGYSNGYITDFLYYDYDAGIHYYRYYDKFGREVSTGPDLVTEYEYYYY